MIASILLLGLFGSARAESPRVAHGPDAVPVHVAYTVNIFRQMAENDIKAAITVWGRALADEMAVDSYADVEVFPGRGNSRQAL